MVNDQILNSHLPGACYHVIQEKEDFSFEFLSLNSLSKLELGRQDTGPFSKLAEAKHQ